MYQLLMINHLIVSDYLIRHISCYITSMTVTIYETEVYWKGNFYPKYTWLIRSPN